jgi:hypothetical protein
MKRNSSKAVTAWYVVGGLALLTLTVFIVREVPAMRREARIYKM